MTPDHALTAENTNHTGQKRRPTSGTPQGRSVRLHPLAVVLPVATGFVLIGVIGALLAVPVVAVLDAGIRSLYQAHPPDPDTVDPLNPRSART